VQWQLDVVSAHLQLAVLNDERINRLQIAAELPCKLKVPAS